LICRKYRVYPYIETMVDSKALVQATLGAGLEFFHAPSSFTGRASEGTLRVQPAMVPIRALSPRHREYIAQHLLALDAHDRYLRFGYSAQEAQIRNYVDQLDFERDEIYGIYNRSLVLIAVAHLAFSSDPQTSHCAEFGVSVLSSARGKGYGTLLFSRAITHARNQGVDLMFIHALSENAAMLKIATNAGARVERDGSESEAYLKLPPPTLDSRMSEAVEDRFAEWDFQLKVQAKRFWEFLANVQEIRCGVRQGRHKSAE
jgi:GNAT superfamily N-acetyltransferase